MRDTIFNDGTMWPVNIFGSPGILMSQTCVNPIVVPSGEFILSGFIVIRLLLTSVLSMMKIVVAPVSAIALYAAMVSVFKYCNMGFPNVAQAVATIKGRSHTTILLMR